MGQLFGRECSVITKHLRNAFAESELEADSVCAKFTHTAVCWQAFMYRDVKP